MTLKPFFLCWHPRDSPETLSAALPLLKSIDGFMQSSNETPCQHATLNEVRATLKKVGATLNKVRATLNKVESNLEQS
jgi:hypothetical protein